MDEWLSLYRQAAEVIEGLGSQRPFFRGHGDSSWPLVPSLGRFVLDSGSVEFHENNTYYDFIVRAGDLIPPRSDSWNILFTMQHHGLPTRLLDWSETFGVALYFALREGEGDGTVWVLDPFKLNEATIKRYEIMCPTDLKRSYADYYVERLEPLEGDVVAISPLRHNPRVSHQRAGFTLHDNLDKSLEDLHPEALARIDIPAKVRAGAAKFLKLAGISEFSLFPDLDGLARELKRETFDSLKRKEYATNVRAPEG